MLFIFSNQVGGSVGTIILRWLNMYNVEKVK
jgi:hypothetical protein